MVHVKFKYTKNKNNIKKECIVKSVEECIKLYNLDKYEYRIISVEEVK